MQIKNFREGSKYYIIIENPSKETQQKLDRLLDTCVDDLTSILTPEPEFDAATEASEIDSKMVIESVATPIEMPEDTNVDAEWHWEPEDDSAKDDTKSETESKSTQSSDTNVDTEWHWEPEDDSAKDDTKSETELIEPQKNVRTRDWF